MNQGGNRIFAEIVYISLTRPAPSPCPECFTEPVPHQESLFVALSSLRSHLAKYVTGKVA